MRALALVQHQLHSCLLVGGWSGAADADDGGAGVVEGWAAHLAAGRRVVEEVGTSRTGLVARVHCSLTFVWCGQLHKLAQGPTCARRRSWPGITLQ